VSEKKRREREPLPALLPNVCCGRCAHGRPKPNPMTLQNMIECRCGPPSVTFYPIQDAITGQRGMGVQSGWPVVQPTESCDGFQERIDGAAN
jgi:hypothetical protein